MSVSSAGVPFFDSVNSISFPILQGGGQENIPGRYGGVGGCKKKGEKKISCPKKYFFHLCKIDHIFASFTIYCILIKYTCINFIVFSQNQCYDDDIPTLRITRVDPGIHWGICEHFTGVTMYFASCLGGPRALHTANSFKIGWVSES